MSDIDLQREWRFWVDAMLACRIGAALERLEKGHSKPEDATVLEDGIHILKHIIEGTRGLLLLQFAAAPEREVIHLIPPAINIILAEQPLIVHERDVALDAVISYLNSIVRALKKEGNQEDYRRAKEFFTKLAKILTSQISSPPPPPTIPEELSLTG